MNTKKRCSIHHCGLECKSRKLRNTWKKIRKKKEIPGFTGKFGLGVQNEAGLRLTEFCQENALVIANTLFQQHKKQFYTQISPNGQYQNQIDYIFL